MKLILTEKVPTLGNIGDLVNVTPGYARNYLLPKKVAVLADEKNRSALEAQQKRLSKKIQAEKSVAEALKAKIDGITIEFIKRIGANGKLFGSVTTTELSKYFQDEKKLDVEKRILVIETPIKSIGTFDVRAKLFTGVEAKFKVKITMDAEQAKELKALEEEAKVKKAAKAKADAEAKVEAAKQAETTEA